MCTASTAKRRRRQARVDTRYKAQGPGAGDASQRRLERRRAKALAEGRSFGYSKKKGG